MKLTAKGNHVTIDSFFIYRLPEDSEFHGAMGYLQSGIHVGFVIAAFDDTAHPYTICPVVKADISDITDFLKSNQYNSCKYSFADLSTTKPEHRLAVETIVNSLGQGEKCVSSRVLVNNYDNGDSVATVIPRLYKNLCKAYSNALVYCFGSPDSGVWIGATPEILLQKSGNTYKSISLAGTIDAKSDIWDKKNLEEQSIVTKRIVDILKYYNLAGLTATAPYDFIYGKIKHLRSDITATGLLDTQRLTNLLGELSPTPALAGEPRDKAFDLISKTESFQRAFYGGYCGPYYDNGDSKLYVILRSLWLERDRYAMYAGGGITSQSTPEAEWIETERKANSILQLLKD